MNLRNDPTYAKYMNLLSPLFPNSRGGCCKLIFQPYYELLYVMIFRAFCVIIISYLKINHQTMGIVYIFYNLLNPLLMTSMN